MQRFFLFFFLSAITIAAASQQPQFTVRYYNTENGLPSNGIKGLQWDKETGFLWIATEAGIVRYNGLEFKTFSSNDEAHITNERVLFLIKNNQGIIHTADNNGNIFKIQKNRLQFLESKFIFGNAKSNTVSIAVSDKLYKSTGDFDVSGPFSLQFSTVLPVNDSSTFIQNLDGFYFLGTGIKSPVPVRLAVRPVSAFKCGNNIFVTDSLRNTYV